MKRLVKNILSIIFSLLLFIVILFTAFEVIVYNLDYYESHYIKRGIPSTIKMNLSELMIVTDNMLEYLKDNRDNLDMKAIVENEVVEVFGVREKAHMVDVKNLFVGATFIRNYGLMIDILIIAIFLVMKKKKFLISLFSSIKYVFMTSIGLLLIIGYLLYSNFSKYFTIFHELFFDNDLWLLDPRTDILINMVPEDFFFETAMYILIIFFVSSIIVIVMGELVKTKLKKNLNTK